MTAKLHLTLLCALSALPLACSPAAPPASAIAAPTWVPLTQQALLGFWVLAEVSGQPVPPGISLSFSPNGAIEGGLTCGNELDGRYWVHPHSIQFGGRTTERGCDPLALHAAAEKTLFRRFVAHLSPDLRHLYIRGEETLLFKRRTADVEVRPIVAKDALQGRWNITAVNGRKANGLWLDLGGEGLGTVTRTEKGLLVGSPQPRTRAHLGCNSWYPNGWIRNGDKLTFGTEMSDRTEMGCDRQTEALEEQAYAILRKTMTMEFIPPGRLRLINENGTVDLVRQQN